MTNPAIDQVLTFGVEEEFVLADTATRVAVPRAAEVVEKAGLRLGEYAQAEFFASQVEFATAPCRTAMELSRQLARARRVGAVAAATTGSLLVPSASAVLSRRPLPVTAGARYEELAERYQSSIGAIRSEYSGCHVHLGTLSRSEAVLLGNYLRVWLPVLQAICVNSPFAAGRDRMCASWRFFDGHAWPTVEPAPVLGDEAAYERVADELTTQGPLVDRKMIYWYSRPSEHCPTVEVRIADVSPDLDVVLLYAVLLRGLGTTLLAEARRERPWPGMDQALLENSHRQVAMDGLRGRVVDPDTGEPVLAGRLLDKLVQRSQPGLAAAGDTALVERLMHRFRRRGTAAARQRAVYRRRGRLSDVVDSLALR